MSGKRSFGSGSAKSKGPLEPGSSRGKRVAKPSVRAREAGLTLTAPRDVVTGGVTSAATVPRIVTPTPKAALCESERHPTRDVGVTPEAARGESEVHPTHPDGPGATDQRPRNEMAMCSPGEGTAAPQPLENTARYRAALETATTLKRRESRESAIDKESGLARASGSASESESHSEGEIAQAEPIHRRKRICISQRKSEGLGAGLGAGTASGNTQAVSNTPGVAGLRVGVCRTWTPSSQGAMTHNRPGTDDAQPRLTPPRAELRGSQPGSVEPSVAHLKSQLAQATATINDQKLKLKERDEEKRLSSNHAALLLERLTSLTARNKLLEEQKQQSTKLITDMQQQLRMARREGEDDAKGDGKGRKPRKNHKDVLQALRNEVVEKMVDEKGAVRVLRNKMILKMDESFLRHAASRAARSLTPVLAESKKGAQRSATSWVPEPRLVQGGRGTLPAAHVKSCGAAELVRIPENPLLAGQRPLYGGGFVSINGLLMKSGAPSDYGALTVQWAKAALTRNLTLHGANETCHDLDSESPRSMTVSREPSSETFSEEDLSKAAAEVAETGVKGAIQNLLVRAVGEVKKSFTDKFFRSALTSDRYGTRGVLASLPLHARLAVACALGAGDFATVSEVSRSSSIAAWSLGLHKTMVPPSNPFSCWRSQTVGEFQTAIDDILQDLLAKHGSAISDDEKGESCEVAEDSWGAQEDERRDVETLLPGSDGGSGSRKGRSVDRLFLNSHAVAAMQTFIGFPGIRSGRAGDGVLTGSTTVLSIARADAWMTTVMTVTRFEAEEELRRLATNSGSANESARVHGKRNSRFNVVFASIFPLAVEALLRELRGVLVEWTKGGDHHDEEGGAGGRVMLTQHATQLGLNRRSIELHAPFFPGVADEVRSVYERFGEMDGGSKSDGEVEVSDTAYLALQIQVVDDSCHRGDVFLLSGRRATTAFAVEDTKSSESNAQHFIALTPEFFRSNVCYWLGDVLDAYVGRWDPSSKLPTSCKSSIKRGPDRNGTFYAPMSFRDLPTHLDSHARNAWSHVPNDDESGDDQDHERLDSQNGHKNVKDEENALLVQPEQVAQGNSTNLRDSTDGCDDHRTCEESEEHRAHVDPECESE